MCRFHLLSHNVGVVKPSETVSVIKGYANKLDSEGVDGLKHPVFIPFTVSAFIYVNHVSTTL